MGVYVQSSGVFSSNSGSGAIDKSIVSNASLISWHDVAPFSPLPSENVTATSSYLHWAIHLTNITVRSVSSAELTKFLPDVIG